MQFGFRAAALVFVFAMIAVMPVRADVTVVSHYTLISGDTLTRASYYSSKRVRVTSPDGREYMFNAKGDSVTVIDHVARSYWTGPRGRADSLAKSMIVAHRKELTEIAAADPVAWGEKVQAFNDSIQVLETHRSRKIAGYPCDEWVVTAGSYLVNERWVARGLAMANYGPEMQKVVLASIRDNLGRQLMRMMIDMRTKPGLVLAGRATFKTLQNEGTYEFEALQVISAPIPKSAWMIPKGYTAIQL
jgi:hypothetical protein